MKDSLSPCLSLRQPTTKWCICKAQLTVFTAIFTTVKSKSMNKRRQQLQFEIIKKILRSLSYSVFNLSKKIHRVYAGWKCHLCVLRKGTNYGKCGRKSTGTTVKNSCSNKLIFSSFFLSFFFKHTCMAAFFQLFSCPQWCLELNAKVIKKKLSFEKEGCHYVSRKSLRKCIYIEGVLQAKRFKNIQGATVYGIL